MATVRNARTANNTKTTAAKTATKTKAAPAKAPAKKEKPAPAVVLLTSLLGAVAQAISSDEKIAALAADQYGLVLSEDAELDVSDAEADDFEEEEVEEEEEAPKAKARGKKKKLSAADIADQLSEEGDISLLDDLDDDTILEVAEELEAPAKYRKTVKAALGWLAENYASEEEEGEEDEGEGEEADDFDVDTAEEEELDDFLREHDPKKYTNAKLRKMDEEDKRELVAELLAEAEGSDEDDADKSFDEDEDDFEDDDFDDENL